METPAPATMEENTGTESEPSGRRGAERRGCSGRNRAGGNGSRGVCVREDDARGLRRGIRGRTGPSPRTSPRTRGSPSRSKSPPRWTRPSGRKSPSATTTRPRMRPANSSNQNTDSDELTFDDVVPTPEDRALWEEQQEGRPGVEPRRDRHRHAGRRTDADAASEESSSDEMDEMQDAPADEPGSGRRERGGRAGPRRQRRRRGIADPAPADGEADQTEDQPAEIAGGLRVREAEVERRRRQQPGQLRRIDRRDSSPEGPQHQSLKPGGARRPDWGTERRLRDPWTNHAKAAGAETPAAFFSCSGSRYASLTMWHAPHDRRL